MEPFNEAIGLRMEGGCVDVMDVEKCGEVGPNLGCELWARVGGNGVGKAKTGNPVSAEGLGTDGGHGGG